MRACLLAVRSQGHGASGAYALALGGLAAALIDTRWPWSPQHPSPPHVATVIIFANVLSSSLLIGVTMAAMLLGHWYLNTPGMELVPLRRLVHWMTLAILARMLLNGIGLVMQTQAGPPVAPLFWTFVAFRWLAGLLGPLVMSRLAWNTLKVPNTQSATGILYAGVVLVFLGELISQLLSVDTLYPL